MKKISLAVLVSGSGTNLQAIIDAIKGGRLDAEIKVVISNDTEAYALKRAEENGIPTQVIDKKEFPSRKGSEAEIISAIDAREIDLICLAGFMKLFSPEFVRRYRGRIMNIHPALLPSFPGLHAHARAIEYGVKVSGCTVHFVDEGTDTGPIILQTAVEVLPDDTEEELAARVLKEEHRIYPRAIQLFAEGRLKIEGRKVLIKTD